MSPEKAKRPEKVTCLECWREFNLLHRSHLITHGYNSQAEYREAHGIDENEPLFSQTYSELRRGIQSSPDKIELSRLVGKDWQLRRRVALVLLEREDLYTPGRTSEIIQVPLQTIYSAIRRGSLPSSRKTLLVETKRGLVGSGDKYIQGVKLEDMLEFAKHHKLKYLAKK